MRCTLPNIVHVSVLVVSGDDDRIWPHRASQRVAAAIPGATFHTIQNCGHLPHEEHTEKLMDVIAAFLNDHVWMGDIDGTLWSVSK